MKNNTSTNILTIKLFWHHAKKHNKFFIPLLINLPVTILIMNFFQPYILSLVLQKISQGNFSTSDLWSSFGNYIIIYSFAVFASGVVGWRLNIWLVWNLELRVVKDLSQKIFSHLMSLSADFHTNRFAGSLVSQANKLTGSYIRFADATLFNFYELIISMVATIVILAPRVPLYAVSLIGFSIIYIVGTIRFSRPVRVANRKESHIQSEQTGYLADSITNIMAIKSFSALNHEKNRYSKITEKTYNAGQNSLRAVTIRETYSSLITSTIGISALVIAIIGAGVYQADIATLFLIVTYTGVVGQKLWEFQNVLRQYNRALGDASDMVEILQIQPSVTDPKIPEKSKIVRGAIELKDITFTHPENSLPLFDKLNLKIKPGEKVGVVGHSGSGKTTLTKLLLRYTDIDSGEINIDNQNINNINQDELRCHIAYVPQEPLLFHRSLSENIAYGRIDASQREIEAIAKLAHAHDFISELSNGYETLVGERGVKLSGGQRQRIAIARAMIKNSPILVLDEATSALDSESEVLIQDALWKLMERRTAIVIAHRLSTIQKMDRIIVLENGKIVEEGGHKELIAKNGTYADLWAHQSGGFIDE